MQTNASWREYTVRLQETETLGHLSLIEASLLLMVLKDVPATGAVCRVLVAKLRGDSWKWIESEKLSISALAVLSTYGYRPAEVDGTCLAYLTNKMLACEAAVGGPYYSNGQKPDIFTNLAVSRLFKTFGSPLPNVDLFLENHIPQGALENDSMIACKVLHEWPRFDFSKHEIAEVMKIFPSFGKALGYRVAPKRVSSFDRMHEIVSDKIHEVLQVMDEPLRTYATDIWEMVSRADVNHEISMISGYFTKSLENQPKRFGKKKLIDLAIANFFVWMAYTIYDDFIDQEGQAELLPVANVMLRHALKIYAAVSSNDTWLQQEISDAFNKMDAANSWELAHCRFEVARGKIHITELPEYSDFQVLANRAKAHILGPLAAVSKLQVSPMQLTDIKKGLSHFLIAKQLSDDLLDWTEDFKKGHISPVVSHILKGSNIMPGAHNLSDITPKMQQYFWMSGWKEMNDIIVKQLTESRRYFKKSRLLNPNGEFFLRIVNPLEESVHENELQALHQKQFLTTYSSKSIKR